ncbi:hypothetical protein ENBRE01_1725 [Enteropsectra breve]|nr:hypothetical protein ENBRE01_1021 [Enteropsectra breve]KAI5150809.1 hypothetical protein ENBRE01_1725 [Enteropsectra breve]
MNRMIMRFFLHIAGAFLLPEETIESLTICNKPAENTNVKVYKIVNNGLRINILSSQVFQKTYLSMHVAVGLRDSPDELLGLPHLIEHIVACHKSVYNKNSILSAKALAANGVFKLSTGFKSTDYTLVASSSRKIFELIEQLGCLVCNTQFVHKVIKKELKILDAEIEGIFSFDSPLHVIFMLHRIAEKGTVAHKMHPGSSRTLKKTDENIIFKFYKDFYTRENTVISVATSQNIEEIKQSVLKGFTGLNNGVSKPRPALISLSDPTCIKEKYKNKIILYESVLQGKCELIVCIPLRDITFKGEPGIYHRIEEMLTNKADSCLEEILKRSQLAYGYRIVYSHEDSDYHCLNMFISVTPRGHKKYSELLLVIELYFRALRSVCLPISSGFAEDCWNTYTKSVQKLKNSAFLTKLNHSCTTQYITFCKHVCEFISEYGTRESEAILNDTFKWKAVSRDAIERGFECLCDRSRWIAFLSAKAKERDKQRNKSTKISIRTKKIKPITEIKVKELQKLMDINFKCKYNHRTRKLERYYARPLHYMQKCQDEMYERAVAQVNALVLKSALSRATSHSGRESILKLAPNSVHYDGKCGRKTTLKYQFVKSSILKPRLVLQIEMQTLRTKENISSVITICIAFNRVLQKVEYLSSDSSICLSDESRMDKVKIEITARTPADLESLLNLFLNEIINQMPISSKELKYAQQCVYNLQIRAEYSGKLGVNILKKLEDSLCCMPGDHYSLIESVESIDVEQIKIYRGITIHLVIRDLPSFDAIYRRVSSAFSVERCIDRNKEQENMMARATMLENLERNKTLVFLTINVYCRWVFMIMPLNVKYHAEALFFVCIFNSYFNLRYMRSYGLCYSADITLLENRIASKSFMCFYCQSSAEELYIKSKMLLFIDKAKRKLQKNEGIEPILSHLSVTGAGIDTMLIVRKLLIFIKSELTPGNELWIVAEPQK